ncbi:MAG: very short patch repair endonuclease [Candidatus Methanogranum gryphiswaldense]|nr:MAG: very short patch repair endonuclease [Candidatus Methanogranum sp. U3.2.1]
MSEDVSIENDFEEMYYSSKKHRLSHAYVLSSKLSKIYSGYKKDIDDLPGCPDIVYLKQKIAVYCVSDLWHCRDVERVTRDTRYYADFWLEMIARSIRMDLEIDKEMNELGYTVVRVWNSDIDENPDEVAEYIKKIVDEQKVK